MIDSPTTASQTEQARLELSLAAEQRLRSNRPRGLVIAAGALVVLATIGLLTGLSARAAAQIDLSSRRADLDRLRKAKSALEDLNRQVESRGLSPDPRMAGKIEAMAQASGLRMLGGVSDTSEVGNVTGMVRRTYTAQIQPGEDPAAVMRFLATTQMSDQTRWLEISQLRLTPGAPTPGKTVWNTDVRFARMERTEGRR